MNRIALLSALMIIFLWPSHVAVPPRPEPARYPVSESMKLSDDQLSIATQVEKRMRYHGFSDESIAGALINAYAESKLNVNAVGRAGEIGIFQLNPRGLGRNMSTSDMRDVRKSVDRVARAMKKNDKIMKLEARGADIDDHVRAFCTEIERPKNRYKKAKDREKMIEKMMVD